MKKKLVRQSVLWFLFLWWLAITIHLGYRYLLFVSDDGIVKAGTFVEWVDRDLAVSYLPYTNFSQRNRFYQQFLFDSCVDFSVDKNKRTNYEDDFCRVTTKDNKYFEVRIDEWKKRSDGKDVTAKDIYFSYRDILVGNQWNRNELSLYQDVVVDYSTWVVNVTFPQEASDNMMFFSHFILPEHVAKGLSFEQYMGTYVKDPVRSSCALLLPQPVDDDSLVFDLSQCTDTSILSYQLKLVNSPLVVEDGQLLYDAMHVDQTVGWKADYVRLSVPSRKYSVLFFNTTSEALSPKIQRALWGLVFHDFYKDDSYKSFLIRDHLMFDHFLSTGDNVANYIASKNPSLPLDKYDLEKIDIWSLPQEIVVNKADDSFTYFLEAFQWYKTLRFSFEAENYKKVTISHNDGTPYTPKTFSRPNDNFFYSLSVYNKNVEEWLNRYVVEWETWKWEKETIVSVDLYYLSTRLDTEKEEIAEEDTLSVLYFDDDLSRSVVSRLRALFVDAWIEDYFSFQSFQDVDQFDGKLLSLDYDLVVRVVDLGLRNDFSALLWSETPTLNPSVYDNDLFVSHLSSYINNPDEWWDFLYEQLMSVYRQDVPFVILGNVYDSFFVRAPLASYLSWGVVGVYDIKSQLLEEVVFSRNGWFVRKDVFNKKNLMLFVDDLRWR